MGLLNGALGFWWLGRTAAGYLEERQVSVFGQIRYGRLDEPSSGVLGRYAESAQKARDDARDKEEQARAARAPSRRRKG